MLGLGTWGFCFGTGDLRRTTAPPRKLYWFFYFFGFWFWVLGCSLSEGWLLLLVCLGVGGVGSLNARVARCSHHDHDGPWVSQEQELEQTLGVCRVDSSWSNFLLQAVRQENSS